MSDRFFYFPVSLIAVVVVPICWKTTPHTAAKFYKTSEKQLVNIDHSTC